MWIFFGYKCLVRDWVSVCWVVFVEVKVENFVLCFIVDVVLIIIMFFDLVVCICGSMVCVVVVKL